jgi:hypothetical protein
MMKPAWIRADLRDFLRDFISEEKSMIKSQQLNLGELIQIELPNIDIIRVRVNYVRDHEIWTQKFALSGMGLEGLRARVQIIRDKQIWVPKYLDDDAMNVNPGNYEYYIDTCLCFDAVIQKNELLQDMEMSKLERISEIVRMQRRKTFRLKHFFDVSVSKADKNILSQKCQGVDISEAGIGINTTCGELLLGDALNCEFELEGEKYTLPATVVRRVDKLAEEGFFRVGIRFEIEKEKQIRFIRRFIYKKQIERNGHSKSNL